MKRPLVLSFRCARDRILVISRSLQSRPPIAGALDHPRQDVAEVDARDAARRFHAIAERSHVEAQMPHRPVALRVFASRALSIENLDHRGRETEAPAITAERKQEALQSLAVENAELRRRVALADLRVSNSPCDLRLSKTGAMECLRAPPCGPSRGAACRTASRPAASR